MNRLFKKLALSAATASVALVLVAAPGRADEAGSAADTYRDIEATLGGVPAFFRMFPEAGIPGAWAEFKAIQLNPDTQLSGKQKELIGLAVAAQIPCAYCVYFHTKAAMLNGATEEEVKETVAMAAIVRHWSTVLNGMQVDLDAFRRQTDELLALAEKKAMEANSANTSADGKRN